MAPSPMSGQLAWWARQSPISTVDVSPLAPRAVNTRSLCLQCWAREADSSLCSSTWGPPPAQRPGLDCGLLSHQEGRTSSPLPVAQGRVGSGQDVPPGRDGLTPAQVAGPHCWVLGPAIPHQLRALPDGTWASEAQAASAPVPDQTRPQVPLPIARCTDHEATGAARVWDVCHQAPSCQVPWWGCHPAVLSPGAGGWF